MYSSAAVRGRFVPPLRRRTSERLSLFAAGWSYPNSRVLLVPSIISDKAFRVNGSSSCLVPGAPYNRLTLNRLDEIDNVTPNAWKLTVHYLTWSLTGFVPSRMRTSFLTLVATVPTKIAKDLFIIFRSCGLFFQPHFGHGNIGATWPAAATVTSVSERVQRFCCGNRNGGNGG